MDSQPIPDLDELARREREALEAALEEMVHSGFGDLESKLPAAEPARTPPPAHPLTFW